MNVGIIDIGWKELSEETLSKQALGGSETWLLSVTKELSRQGHIVDVYCNTQHNWIKDGKFISVYNIINEFQTLNHTRKRYDFMILNRVIHRYNTDIITLIRQYNMTDNIFIQMHDLSLLYEDHLATEQELRQSGIFDKRVRGIVFLTDWHKQNFEKQYPILNSIPKYIIPNGLDLDLIPKDKPEPDHRILWSSCAERGLDVLIDMYDKIKREIPDFGIDVAGYNDLSKLNVGNRDIRILGNLSKEQLYREMNKHGVWFYPGTFAETFCITMIENMACGNIVISPFTCGTQDVVSFDYRYSVHNYYGQVYSFDGRSSELSYINYVESLRYATKAIIEALKNRNETLVNNGREIARSYTWSSTAEKYINLFNHLMYRDVEIKHKYKGIFLSQSSNIEFFKRESEVVEETWAKSLIEGLYPDYTYFRYTACDEQHLEPCIDGHIIYVTNDDTLEHTYEKMRDAYRLLLENGYDFEYMFRTNTSTYINVEKTIEAFKMLRYDKTVKAELCGYYHLLPDGTRRFQFNCFIGNAYMMTKNLADRIFLSRFDSSIHSIPNGDDIITNCILNELTDPQEIYHTPINPTGKHMYDLCYRYKHLIDPEHETDPEHINRYTEDPNVVNNWVCISVRVKALDYETRIKTGEYEHLRELHQAYMKKRSTN